MTEKEQLMQGLLDAGCDAAACTTIGSLFEVGNTREVLRRMRLQRCELVDEMHKSQRKVDRMDYLIHAQEKRMK
jgi:hypothetical protein